MKKFISEVTICLIVLIVPISGFAESLDLTQVNDDAFGVGGNTGAYSMTILGSYLYVGTSGVAAVWRTSDGTTWTQVNLNGFGNSNNVSIFAMGNLSGYIYAGTSNTTDGAEVWESPDGTTWNNVISGGYGNTNCTSVDSMAVFVGNLYVGVTNPTNGAEIWKKTGGSGWSHAKTGGFGDADNQCVLSMAVFGSYLYAGTQNWTTGAQVWRTSDGSNWTQVEDNGFANTDNAAILAMAVFDNKLFVVVYNDVSGGRIYYTSNGTSWSSWQRPWDSNNWSSEAMAVFGSYLYVGTRNDTSGTELWGSATGTGGWTQVNIDGFEDANNICTASMAIFNNLLYMGTYNSATGAEVWRGNIAPTLVWTGEANYETDGLDPETGDTATNFTYRVKYTDPNNDAPASGYPKVYIKKGGTDISGSPFTMSEVDPGDTTYSDGKLYTYSKSGLATGTDYTYSFEAKDINSADATGDPTNPIDAPDVNNAPTLAWTGEANYTSDGIHPEIGDTSTNFVYRVRYTDEDNDAPASGYPKVYIKKGGTDISGSPFTMSEVDPGDTTYSDGKLYTYSKSGLATGTDYTYSFEAKDINSADATGDPTNPIDAPDVGVPNNAPALAWTGEANYTSDGVHPETGNTSTNFVYRVRYTDEDNDAPASGYPKVYIKKGGTDISGSPFTMSEVDPGDTTYSDGKLYTYSKSGLATGTDYTYSFEAKDINSADATGDPTNPIDAPDVNNAPTLAWTEEANYTSDGLHPETGNTSANFVYRINYTDEDNDEPKAGYPRVHMKKGGTEISGSPFTMSEVELGDTTYTDGKLYTYSTTLTAGGYIYYFEAYDICGAKATGEPIDEKEGPTVIGKPPETKEMKVYHGVFKSGENEKCYVSFNLEQAGETTIKVYNSIGREVKELYRGTANPGLTSIPWDGTDKNGNKVSSGVYIIRIEGPGIKQQKRVVVVR